MAIRNTAATVIITNGLYYEESPACKFGAEITSHFSLCYVIVPPQGGMGGSVPLAPGEIQHFYKPVDPSQQYYVVPRDKEAEYFAKYTNVITKVKIGSTEFEKTFRVRHRTANVLMTITSVVNTTRDKIKLSVNKLKLVTAKAIITVKNLVVRRK